MLDYLYDSPIVTQMCPDCLNVRATIRKRELTPIQRRQLRQERLGLEAPIVAYQLYEEVERFTYKPGWRMWIECMPRVGEFDDRYGFDRVRLRIEFDALDSQGSGRMIPIGGRHLTPMWIDTLSGGKLSDDDLNEFRRWLAHTVIDAEIHESREWLRLDGETFDDPHRTGKR